MRLEIHYTQLVKKNEYLVEDWISRATVEKYLLALALVTGSVKVALLSMMALGDFWFLLFREIIFFILFQLFFKYF